MSLIKTGPFAHFDCGSDCDPPRCDLCGSVIPEEYRGEDDIACCGLEFCSFGCLQTHVRN